MSAITPSSPAATPFIVAIGASAGGLDACRQFLAALPSTTGFAFILVQHLDPTHDSMLVELLSGHTHLQVVLAADGSPVQAEHLHVIPPGVSLSLRDGLLHLSPPTQRHGTRMPFDILLSAMADDAPTRSMAVVLSGTGDDGSRGALALRQAGGFVIAQEPSEACFDGMPRAAIAAGAIDLVLPIAAMPRALQQHARKAPVLASSSPMAAIVALLHRRTASDFSLYKPGTLRRRVERRMGLVGCATLPNYLARLEIDAAEAALLAKDLLIHVTSFFRDAEVFEELAAQVIPALLSSHPPGRPLRIWVAGCSTGEETWSLAILFREAIIAAGLDIRLQIFASDKDADAVASARQARYPATIAADVSAERLARFFTHEGEFWCVGAELRALVVFTVQDLLTDPPFSQLDFVSCRNLLIYLKPQAQARVIALFHFALRPDGVLLLGQSETLGAGEAGFALVAKSARIWRRAGPERLPGVPPRLPVGEVTVRPAPRNSPFTRQARLAELCRRLVLQHHAPAAVLLDAKGRCLHALGPIDRYLSHPVGAATQEVLALARPTLRGRLRAALAKHAAMGGEGVLLDAVQAPVLELRTVRAENEAMLLLCFLEPAAPAPTADRGPARERPRILALEQELESTRAELRGAIQDLELAAEDQRAANEEALSVNEEFQSTNEELLTSKEELQSLNEELTALNGQLQETLENSRTTSTDLQNVLFSTEVATLFLDAQLCIRFFTPATRAIFAVLASDIGRPLADLRSLASDAGLLEDAAAVLQGGAPRVQEIVTATGTWFTRRVLPYRAQNGSVEGVVMTFADITLRRESADALHAARALAEQASAAKSRFLSAASHDLRQPLQTLTLLQGLLARSVQSGSSAEVAELVALLEPTLAAMSGMLNTLLDINQIDAGTLLPVPVDFALGPLLERLAQEFGYLARAQGLELRVVPTSLAIRSDPQMLEQILRNLISNALKYTRKGRVLLGCRRRGAMLSIKVWDTGIGIATHEQQAIFDEYHQVGNAARERDQGLGLGLSIVQRFAGVLGHKLAVRSVPGRGSVFTIEVPRVALSAVPAALAPDAAPARTGTILVVEDDPDLRELLVRLLTAEGHSATAVVDGDAALALLARGGLRPDLLLTDHNLPGGYDGPRLAGVLRARIAPELPVVILTADVTTQALRAIASLECVLLHKPVKPDDLAAVLQRLLPATAPRAVAPAAVPPPGRAVVHIVDDDAALRVLLRRVLEKDGRFVIDHASAEDFLVSYRPGGETCLLLDGNLPGQSGYALLAGLRAGGDAVPAIILTGFSDVQSAVAAMRAGASDFIEKPVRPQTLVRCIAQAMERARDLGKRNAWHDDAAERLARLTPRQRAVMDRVLAGEPSKNIAADLGISQRTVETHRAAIMERTGAASLPALARLALAAAPPATST